MRNVVLFTVLPLLIAMLASVLTHDLNAQEERDTVMRTNGKSLKMFVISETRDQLAI